MRSAESLFAPRLIPTIPRLGRAASRRAAASPPPLLNPMRLITARSRVRRNSRGLGLPGCGNGVTEPTSAKPKPSPSNASGTSPSLSKPTAMPSGFGKSIPATVVASGPPGGIGEPEGRNFSARIARRCAASGSSANNKGRIERNHICTGLWQSQDQLSTGQIVALPNGFYSILDDVVAQKTLHLSLSYNSQRIFSPKGGIATRRAQGSDALGSHLSRAALFREGRPFFMPSAAAPWQRATNPLLHCARRSLDETGTNRSD